jgi:secreted trypsin-like serine protease
VSTNFQDQKFNRFAQSETIIVWSRLPGGEVWMRRYCRPIAVGCAVISTLGPARTIIGGNLAGPDEFSWEVALQKTGQDVVFCGGSHLGGGWIVTAAHCVYKLRGGDFNVFYGSNDVLSGGHKVPLTADPFVDKKWDPSNNHLNDIALIKINAPADLQAARIILDAVEPPEIDPNAMLTISGWGLTDPAGPNNLDLQKAAMPVSDRDACEAKYAPEPLSDTQVCLQSCTAGACHGDSVGPSQVSTRMARYSSGLRTRRGPSAHSRTPQCFHALPGSGHGLPA